MNARRPVGSSRRHDRGRWETGVGDNVQDGRRSGAPDAVGGRHGAMNRGRNARYGLRGCRMGEASNPGPPKTSLRRLGPSRSVSQRRRSRSRGEPVELSSDEETVIPPTRRDSIMGTGSTVPANPRALRDAGVCGRGEQGPLKSPSPCGRQMPSSQLAPARRSPRELEVHTNSLCVEMI